jgi:hypothetical protein
VPFLCRTGGFQLPRSFTDHRFRDDNMVLHAEVRLVMTHLIWRSSARQRRRAHQDLNFDKRPTALGFGSTRGERRSQWWTSPMAPKAGPICSGS